MKNIDKTKMKYDFLIDYLKNHCEKLTGMTEDNKRYYKKTKCFYNEWIITFEQKEDETIYVDRNDSTIFYILSYTPERENSKEYSKRAEKHHLEIKKEEWQELRSNRVYSRGDKTKKGNPNLRIVTNENKNFLEVSTLNKTETNRAVKVRFEVYLPQKLSTTTAKVNGRNYKQMFLDYIQTGEAYQVEIIRRNGKYYCHITFEESIVRPYENLYTGHKGIIGVDTNPNGFALTMIDNKGNYKWHTYLKNEELTYARSDRRQNLCGELVKQVVLIAKVYNLGIAVEDLKFHNDKDVNKKFARIKHQFIYRQLLTMLECTCKRSGIEIVKVKPQFTSKIGLYKYCHQYGLVVHNGASMVIGRRSYKFKEKVPKILKEKTITDLEKFEKKNEWSKWNEINKNIKRKVGENPALWLIIRKKILGIA